LIETTLALSRSMKRDGYKQRRFASEVGLVKNVCDWLQRRTEQLSQPMAEALATVEFQLQNGSAQIRGIKAIAAS